MNHVDVLGPVNPVRRLIARAKDVGALVLIVTSADGGPARLVLEGDTTGRIASWRIGVPPQVFYVEGCG
jgi:hypothetical protein